MAAVAPTITDIKAFGDNAHVVSWTPLTTTNDTGTAIEMAGSSIRSIQFAGTFGAGGTIVLQGSNDGTNYVTLTDPQGTAISKTAAAIEQIEEVTRYIRPFVSAGDGTTSLTATLCLVRRGR